MAKDKHIEYGTKEDIKLWHKVAGDDEEEETDERQHDNTSFREKNQMEDPIEDRNNVHGFK